MSVDLFAPILADGYKQQFQTLPFLTTTPGILVQTYTYIEGMFKETKEALE